LLTFLTEGVYILSIFSIPLIKILTLGMMSQTLVSLQSSTESLHQLQHEHVELQRCLSAQQKVLHSLESRVGRSLEVLQVYLDQLKAVGSDLDCSNHLNCMEAEVSRLCDLLSDATLLQKLEAGKVIANFEVLDPYEILVAASRHLVEPRDGSNSRLICRIVPDLPAIYADQELTEAVIADLLARGLKYSDTAASVILGAEVQAGKLRIWVTAQRFAPPGQREFAPEIALCCKRIEVQGGEVTCQADENGYSVVSVLLPNVVSQMSVGEDSKLSGQLVESSL
jgi:signal transduction histidine kinase